MMACLRQRTLCSSSFCFTWAFFIRVVFSIREFNKNSGENSISQSWCVSTSQSRLSIYSLVKLTYSRLHRNSFCPKDAVWEIPKTLRCFFPQQLSSHVGHNRFPYRSIEIRWQISHRLTFVDFILLLLSALSRQFCPLHTKLRTIYGGPYHDWHRW